MATTTRGFGIALTCYNTGPAFRKAPYWSRHAGGHLEAGALARKIVDLLAEKQAEDVLLLDISRVASFADYFVVASAGTTRQLDAMLDSVLEGVSDEEAKPMGREGNPDSGWVLLDYGDVVVHLFGQEERDRYDLEGLWHDATPVLRVQ
jgi:ribosome-associated protein